MNSWTNPKVRCQLWYEGRRGLAAFGQTSRALLTPPKVLGLPAIVEIDFMCGRPSRARIQLVGEERRGMTDHEMDIVETSLRRLDEVAEAVFG